jgi:hypothetical protein
MTFSCRSALRAGRCTDRPTPACAKRHRTLALFALIGTLAIAGSALAANDRPRPSPQTSPEAPPADFQEHGPGMTELHGIVTPQRITKEIEVEARKEQDPSDFYSTYYMFWAESASEYAALAHYSLLILTVVAQEGQSLPLRNVYIRTLDQRIPLAKIGSWRVNVEPGLASSRIYGPYREDAFYLFPSAALFRKGQVQVDFAAGRSGFPVLEMPTQWIPKELRRFGGGDPPQGAMPNLRALQGLIRRNTGGFPIPDSLPRPPELKMPPVDFTPPAALLKPSPAEPKVQAPEPSKPGSLKDLFKRP